MKIKLIYAFCTAIILFSGCKPTGKKSTNNTQKDDSPKVILITTDGLRWQELFTGADSLLVTNKSYVRDTTALKKEFWRSSPIQRRQTLLPFFWSHIKENGVIYGNRNYDNKVNLTNGHWFSYPGYHEILCGFADDSIINSNRKMNNPDITILEQANLSQNYKGKVAAFTSWDVFPYIINTSRSGVPVNAGFDIAKGDDLTDAEKTINKLEGEIPSPFKGVRLDGFTHNYALEYMGRKHPKLLYIAYGETDDFAHQGKYNYYLHAAKRVDGFIKELYEFTQKDPFYKDNTTFIITTDHGRGLLDKWTSHGKSIEYADQTWIAAFGAGIKNQGEVKTAGQLYSNQVAITIAKLLKIKNLPEKMNKKVLPVFDN